MRQSESINELASALAEAQQEFGGAKKDSANPFFKSKYADLASVAEAIRPAGKHGLSHCQFPSTDLVNHAVIITTILMHKSGQWLSEDLTMPVLKWDAQTIGSAITYGRRYGLQAVYGIASEDDDGNAASGNTKMSDAERAEVIARKTKPMTQPVSTQSGQALAGILKEQMDEDATGTWFLLADPLTSKEFQVFAAPDVDCKGMLDMVGYLIGMRVISINREAPLPTFNLVSVTSVKKHEMAVTRDEVMAKKFPGMESKKKGEVNATVNQ